MLFLSVSLSLCLFPVAYPFHHPPTSFVSRHEDDDDDALRYVTDRSMSQLPQPRPDKGVVTMQTFSGTHSNENGNCLLYVMPCEDAQLFAKGTRHQFVSEDPWNLLHLNASLVADEEAVATTTG